MLLVVNSMNGFSLELVYISIISISSSLTHHHSFQLLVLLPYFLEITFFVCTNRINLLNLKQCSERLVIVAKGFLKLPNVHMLIQQKSPSLPRKLALGTFGILLIVFSTNVNLLYLLYSTTWSCCLLHLIKQIIFEKSF